MDRATGTAARANAGDGRYGLLVGHSVAGDTFYDGDALMDGLAAASTLFSRGRKVRFLRLPRKEDPGSLGRAKVHEIGLASPYFDEMTPAFVLAA